MYTLKDLIPRFERLNGRKITCCENEKFDIQVFCNGAEIGISQFNEILLLLGFDRVNLYFFRYLVSGDVDIKKPTSISSLEELDEGISRFIILALQYYGNVKFAYNILADNSDILLEKIGNFLPNDEDKFKSRNEPLIRIEKINPQDTYLLGYIVDSEIDAKLREDPKNKQYNRLKQKREGIRSIGEKNQIAYSASDHLDVYVATSMRKSHEFLSISKIVNQIFESKELTDIKLRWFDPTQAFCKDRIDKGLSEALMLKRAACTLYLAQESDTLGKDSELASTLAQGKPVIAYVPEGSKEFVDSIIESIESLNHESSRKDILFEQLRVYGSDLAWEDTEVMEWLRDKKGASEEKMINKLYLLVNNYYNRRAKTLMKDHPLGIQVNLNSGVANGVLVVRKVSDCIRLIRAIVMNDLEFDLCENETNNPDTIIYLKEKISDSIFRIKTDNSLLTNAFWNFYL